MKKIFNFTIYYLRQYSPNGGHFNLIFQNKIPNKSTDYYVKCLLQTSIKVQNGHTKVNVKLVQYFNVENTPVEAQINQGSLNFYCADRVSEWSPN